MATSINYSADFPVDPKRLHDALIDKSYWLNRVNSISGEEATCEFRADPEEGPVPEGWFSVWSSHLVPAAELPPAVTNVRSADLRINRGEHWGPFWNNRASGLFTFSVPESPLRVRGDVKLTAKGNGSMLNYTTELQLKVPFLKSKIESNLSDRIVKVLDMVRDFTIVWLASH